MASACPAPHQHPPHPLTMCLILPGLLRQAWVRRQCCHVGGLPQQQVVLLPSGHGGAPRGLAGCGTLLARRCA